MAHMKARYPSTRNLKGWITHQEAKEMAGAIRAQADRAAIAEGLAEMD